MIDTCGNFFRQRNPLKIVGMVLGGIILAGLMAFLFGWIIMLLWNWLMPEIFGLGTITYWQGYGIFFLAKILFGFGGGDHSGSSKKKSKKEKPIRDEIGKEIKAEIRKEFKKEFDREYDDKYEEWWESEGSEAFDNYMENEKASEEEKYE